MPRPTQGRALPLTGRPELTTHEAAGARPVRLVYQACMRERQSLKKSTPYGQVHVHAGGGTIFPHAASNRSANPVRALCARFLSFRCSAPAVNVTSSRRYAGPAKPIGPAYRRPNLPTTAAAAAADDDDDDDDDEDNETGGATLGSSTNCPAGRPTPSYEPLPSVPELPAPGPPTSKAPIVGLLMTYPIPNLGTENSAGEARAPPEGRASHAHPGPACPPRGFVLPVHNSCRLLRQNTG